jgi:hypothetical protein
VYTSKRGKKEYPYIDFSTWHEKCVVAYKDEAIRQMDDLKAQASRIEMRARALLSINGITLAFILAALIGAEKAHPLVFLGEISILVSLTLAIYLLLVKARDKTVFDFFSGADPKAREDLMSEFDAEERILNLYLIRCSEQEDSNLRKDLYIRLSSIIFVIGLLFLLITIIISNNLLSGDVKFFG